MSETIDFVDVYDYLVNHDVDQPVTVVKHGHPHAVMIPYEVFVALQKSNQKALHVSELSADDLDAILNSDIPDECREFDHEVKKK
ncbi:MAG TPA: type II toxin-antitoxin system prevent-host-death family antitoxin [Patescibacteria group bacterium]|nr:type II toxin-antitoxin system prevent-host-death family antitoxin [Patescibacteria group bacterium]